MKENNKIVQFIDKSAVVAEIERIKKEECPTDSYEGRCKMLWFEQFSSFLDILETKEVDLDKEFDRYCENLYAIDIQEAPFIEMYDCAKYFFELGLNAKKGK